MDPVIIGKSAKPRCFRNYDIKSKKVQYYYSQKAWMNTTIFTTWLDKFNLKMCGRKVLLLVDNATSHTVIKEYENVRIVFFGPNLTSRIQPLDAGTIVSYYASATVLYNAIVNRYNKII